MNELNDLKNIYNTKGWVIFKKLFSLDDINLVNHIIDDFLENKLEKINTKSRAINFTDDKKKILKI